MSRESRSPVAASADGRVVAVADGFEVWVGSGRDGSALWKTSCTGFVVGLVICGEQVIALDDGGELVAWSALDGRPRWREELSAPGRALATDGSDRLLVITEQAIELWSPVTGRHRATWTHPGAVGGALGTHRDAAVALWPSGRVALLRAEPSPRVERVFDLPGSPVAEVIGGGARGWLVARAGEVLALSEELAGEAEDSSPVSWRIALSGDPGPLAISRDGLLLAVSTDAERVVVIDTSGRRAHGELSLDTAATGLIFGPGGELVVGLGRGELAGVDLLVGTSWTMTPGGDSSSSRVRDRVDHEALRRVARTAVIGDGPVATLVVGEAPRRRGCWIWGAIGVVVISLMLCCGIGAAVGIGSGYFVR